MTLDLRVRPVEPPDEATAAAAFTSDRNADEHGEAHPQANDQEEVAANVFATC
ncbi:hypothetical protein [Nocardiopsis sp. MG754419]|uniref:hypothetical protein n=1 Tax=Nocardiopsis sp. MG754419 TaxID=2259865 RepID=UPI001BAA666A|nr:hypothetical protein [Nocardiopsis sp. MG754419]